MRLKRLGLVVVVVLVALYVSGPFVDGGLTTRPYLRVVGWDGGLKGFAVCHEQPGPYHVAGARDVFCN